MSDYAAQLTEARRRIIDAGAVLSPEDRDVAFVGEWSAKELLAHLIGWDHVNIDAIADFRAGRLPAFYDHYDPNWATFNASLVERYASDDWQQLLSAAWSSEHAFLAALRDVPEEEIDADRGLRWHGHTITLRKLLDAAVRDETEHAREIEAFSKSRRVA